MSDSWRAKLLSELYERHGQAVLSFVRRYVPDQNSAEDVVQETLVRAWRHIDRFDLRAGNPRAYLLTVARKVLADQWRAEQTRPRAVIDGAAVAAAPSDEDVESALERWVVAEALQRLTPDHRAVVQALHFDGQSVAAAARQLGKPMGTVKSRSYYAIRALRAALEEMGVLR